MRHPKQRVSRHMTLPATDGDAADENIPSFADARSFNLV
jgi:hypothetical protein